MDPLNLQLLVNLSGTFGDRLHQGVDAIRSEHVQGPDGDVRQHRLPRTGRARIRRRRSPQQLEADVKAGAVGVGEIIKDLGLFDQEEPTAPACKSTIPELDPVWEACARLNIPVFIHIADPPEFFEPLDYTNERWLELALYPDRRYQTGVPASRS